MNEQTNDNSKTLLQRVLQGGKWVFALRASNQILAIARLIVIARLLEPKDFGVMGIALLMMLALETFSQTGFNMALIQKPENIDKYLDTVWTVQVIRGIILCGILLAVAPLVAAFYKEPVLTDVIRVIAFASILKGFTNIYVVYFQKELEFNKQFRYQFSANIVDVVVSIFAVFILRNVWGLVIGLLSGQVIGLLMSYIIQPYKPKFEVNLPKFRELFGFGRWILCTKIVAFLIKQGDNALVGKVLGLPTLGLYQMAFRIANIPATEMSHLITTVTFPALSKMQGNTHRMRNAFVKILRVTFFISIPLVAGVFYLAPGLTRVVLGEKWMPMVPALQILCFAGLVRSINSPLNSFFRAIGKPDVITKAIIPQMLLMAVLIYPLTDRAGIIGTSMSVLLSSVVTPSYLFLRMSREIKYTAKNLLDSIKVPVISTFLMLVVLIIFNHIIGQSSILTVSILTVFGILTYSGISLLLDRFFNYYLITTLKSIYKNGTMHMRS